jgi:hypothetical protein
LHFQPLASAAIFQGLDLSLCLASEIFFSKNYKDSCYGSWRAIIILRKLFWRWNMFLKHKNTKTLIEVLTIPDLYNPFRQEILGQSHAGEELQDPTLFNKSELMFPSGEPLPNCWLNPHYLESKTLVNTLSR